MTRYTKRSDLVTRNIGGETIIVPIEGQVGDLDSIYTLNEVASAIWDLVDGRNTIGQIASRISEQYEVTLEEARRDVSDLLASLREAGLVHGEAKAAGE